MQDDASKEQEILRLMRRHLAQSQRAQSLLHGQHDDLPEIGKIRANIEAATEHIRHAIASMEASIAEREATRPPYRIGDAPGEHSAS